MKYIFIVVLVVLIGLSFVAAALQPEYKATAPVIYWVTDPNPARFEQVHLFGDWLKRNHYPDIELRLDTSNNENMKKIIQGVSGVAGDTMDLADVQLFQAVGMLRDVTQDAKRLHYGLDKTYAAVASQLTMPDKQGNLQQYLFPCNVTSNMYFVNRQTFRDFNQPLPPHVWTADEFERRGKAFVQAANPPGARRLYFFADGVDMSVLRRSAGVGMFNETLTACVLNSPGYVESLKRYKKWMDVDHIIPSKVDQSQFNTASGYGGASPQLFNSGNYAMMYSGRYMLIMFRQFDETRKKKGEPLLDMATAELPYFDFPNAGITARALGVYSGGHHQDLATYFQAFLASEDYNLQIVKDADALPPDPKYTELEEYKHPKDHPNEWDVHEPFAQLAIERAVGSEISPFVLGSTASRLNAEAMDAFVANQLTAEQAAKQAQDRIDAEIRRQLSEDPSLRPRYEELVERQKKIDELKARGEKIPAEWVDNPFYQAYYKFKGMLK